MGQCIERIFRKDSLKLNAGPHNNTSWYNDTDGFLEHSPNGGSLYYKGPAQQKTVLGFLGPLSYLLEFSINGIFPQFERCLRAPYFVKHPRAWSIRTKSMYLSSKEQRLFVAAWYLS